MLQIRLGRILLRKESGGAEGDRTPDLRIANATLSHLSYCPTIAADTPKRGPKGGRIMGATPGPVKALKGSDGRDRSALPRGWTGCRSMG